MISCGARLAPFDIQELREIMSYDEMELDMIGDQRTAMFVIISDTDDTFNFVVAIMYTQLFNLLCDKADDEHGGRLSIEANNIREAKPKLERIESDILNNFKILGVPAYPLNGVERLQILDMKNQMIFELHWQQ